MAHTNLAIRQDGPVILASFAGNEDGTDGVVIATMRATVADMHPEAFEKFKAFATSLAQLLLEGVGVEISDISERQVHKAPVQ